MATAIIGGGYMLFTAVLGTFFGTLVDHHRKKQVMVTSSTITLVAYAASGGCGCCSARTGSPTGAARGSGCSPR